MTLHKVLVANRGVAAVRIARTLKQMGIVSVGLCQASEADADYLSVFDEVHPLAGDTVADTFLNQAAILDIARESGAQGIHPGYGFLSEHAEFAQAVHAAGLVFIGPSAQTIKTFGLKHTAREVAQAAGVNLLPGSPLLADVGAAVEAAEEIGYPVILKSTAGGGGIGMQQCQDKAALEAAFATVQALATANFSSADLYLEKYLSAPRHVEVQIFGDGKGEVLVLGDRDCSLQRRNQKLVEECPAPNIPTHVREQLHSQARALAASQNYASAGTVEFLFDPTSEEFYFLEVNTRIQVEHGVTEMVFGVDLIQWMVELAAGKNLDIQTQPLVAGGHAVQVRLYAEDPYLDFRPTPGTIDIAFNVHDGEARIDSWMRGESRVSHLFDPLLANIICHAESRDQALQNLSAVLQSMDIYGNATNRSYLVQALAEPAFCAGKMHTGLLQTLTYQPLEMEIVAPGLQTTVQAHPGRQGYWEVGVPPSGPMDDFSFRAGNRLLGNDEEAAGLEMLVSGASVKFRHATQVVVSGAVAQITLDDVEQPANTVLSVAAGQTLSIGECSEGIRCYLLVSGGITVKPVLGSTTTFLLGGMGGHLGRALRAGDILSCGAAPAAVPEQSSYRLDLHERHVLRVLVGPHTNPDFFTDDDIQVLFDTPWRVHHNSNRTGVRLIGPKPEWARTDGGEAGLHPSNIHDNAYAFGALDFTGDMPVILGPDGPSCGGFVCPAVVINADRWKLGQLNSGDEIRFQAVSEESARAALAEQSQMLQDLGGTAPVVMTNSPSAELAAHDPVLLKQHVPYPLTVRRAGQEWLLLEFGPAEIEIASRVMVHQLVQLIHAEKLPGIVEMTPGIRSLQVRFDHHHWSAADLVGVLGSMATEVMTTEPTALPSRIVRMPLSWNDPACQLAVERYMAGVRADAPWCPDNIEFIRRINGLNSVDEVRELVFDATYLVMGLGDVYLGAPVATPLDPRHRLVTTKYNPARTWTAENSVGIGGSYLCVYGMEGPGGYQFVGRTTQVWRSQGFAVNNNQPWLLDHFDQLQFYSVDAQELLEMREATQRGAWSPEVDAVDFDPSKYEQFLTANQSSINEFKAKRSAAFADELSRWRDEGLLTFDSEPETAAPDKAATEYDGHVVLSPMMASVWRVNSDLAGQLAQADDKLVVLESMKAEFEVLTPVGGIVEMLVQEGQMVEQGQPLAVVRSG